MTGAGRRRGTIRLRRVYDDPGPSDGRRVFVDRLWPRGVPKSAFRFDEWCKAVAPTTVAPLLAAARAGNLTLVYAARDPAHNHALVLKSYLEERLDDR